MKRIAWWMIPPFIIMALGQVYEYHYALRLQSLGKPYDEFEANLMWAALSIVGTMIINEWRKTK